MKKKKYDIWKKNFMFLVALSIIAISILGSMAIYSAEENRKCTETYTDLLYNTNVAWYNAYVNQNITEDQLKSINNSLNRLRELRNYEN